MSQEDFAKKKRLIVLVYATVFGSIFLAATYVAWNRRVEDAKNAQNTAPATSAAQVAPVASR